MKFRTDIDGTVSGIRFYKGEENTGTHIGSLWTAGGARLGVAVFSDESPSGWQEAMFRTPIWVIADTTYVASYHTATGYAVDRCYFEIGDVSGPVALGKETLNRALNCVRLFLHAERPSEHHRRTQDRRERVSDPAARDVRR